MPGKGIQARRLQNAPMLEVILQGPAVVPTSEGSNKTRSLHEVLEKGIQSRCLQNAPMLEVYLQGPATAPRSEGSNKTANEKVLRSRHVSYESTSPASKSKESMNMDCPATPGSEAAGTSFQLEGADLTDSTLHSNLKEMVLEKSLRSRKLTYASPPKKNAPLLSNARNLNMPHPKDVTVNLDANKQPQELASSVTRKRIHVQNDNEQLVLGKPVHKKRQTCTNPPSTGAIVSTQQQECSRESPSTTRIAIGASHNNEQLVLGKPTHKKRQISTNPPSTGAVVSTQQQECSREFLSTTRIAIGTSRNNEQLVLGKPVHKKRQTCTNPPSTGAIVSTQQQECSRESLSPMRFAIDTSRNNVELDDQISKPNSPSGATEDYESEEENHQTNSSNPRRRGLNKNIKLEREVRKHKDLLRKGEKFKPSVTISPDENRPVGEWSASFARELGIIVRRDAPVDVRSWKHIASETKEQLLQQAADAFQIDISKSHVRSTVLGNMQRLYSSWRTKLREHYEECGGGEEAYNNPPDQLENKSDQWVWLCVNVFEDEKLKRRSSANKKNRSMVEFLHKCGSTSFSQKRYSMTNPETKKKPSAIDFFEAAYKNDHGWASPAAEKMAKQMRNKKMEIESNSEVECMYDDIVKEVYTGKSGVIAGNSRGGKELCMERNVVSTTTNLQAIIDKQRADLVAAQEEIKNSKALIAEANAKINFLYQHFSGQLPPQN